MFSKLFVFCIIITLLLVIFANESHSLKLGDVGTCRGRVSSIASRKVPYLATVYCRGTRKICRARKMRVTTYVRWKIGTICCEGWQHDGELDACKPICSTGCLNGTCVAPEKCQCNSPMYLDPSRKNICVSSVCNPPCVNSICIHKQETSEQNGICECLNNTRRYNGTHCAFCEENYKVNADLTCTPECTTPCINGVCIAPNKCRCLEGYKYKDDVTCESNCNQCVNGKCIGPNKCECLPGFTSVNDTHCECDCENGDCVSGVCTCRDGYRLEDGVCEPVCSQECVNGVCWAPGVCTCFEGHAKSAHPRVCCRPECGNVCDSSGECPSIACVPSFIE